MKKIEILNACKSKLFHCVVIPGTNIGETGELGERFLDNKRIEVIIEEMLEEAMNFVRRNMKTYITRIKD